MKKLKKNPRTGYKIIRRCTRANFRNLNELALLTGAISVMPVSLNGHDPSKN